MISVLLDRINFIRDLLTAKSNAADRKKEKYSNRYTLPYSVWRVKTPHSVVKCKIHDLRSFAAKYSTKKTSQNTYYFSLRHQRYTFIWSSGHRMCSAVSCACWSWQPITTREKIKTAHHMTATALNTELKIVQKVLPRSQLHCVPPKK